MFYVIGIWQRAVEAVFPLIHALPKVQSSIIPFNGRKIDIFHKQDRACGACIAYSPSTCFWSMPGIKDGGLIYVKASFLQKCKYSLGWSQVE